MEKASTPRNRLTRSSAKQVNTPKNVDQEESVARSPGEDVKHNVRKTRRTYNTKAKTNGDTSNIENRVNNEDTTEDNVSIKCENDDMHENTKQESQKTTPNKTPASTISRKSLRTRRSLTPGPETESSASKKIKRSSSSGKLDVVSTPTRRGRRAKSESKDFVFTPVKDKQSVPHDLHSKYIPNASLRIIEKIDEVNEGEKSSEDETETLSKIRLDIIGGNECKGEGKTIESTKVNDSSVKDTIVNQSEEKPLTESSVQEINQPTVTETSVQEINQPTVTKTSFQDINQPTVIETSIQEIDKPNVSSNNTDPHEICEKSEVLDIPQNPSEVLIENVGLENYSEKFKDTSKDETCKSIQGSCLLVEENPAEKVNTDSKVEENLKESINPSLTVEDSEFAQDSCMLNEENVNKKINNNMEVESSESAQEPSLLSGKNETQPPSLSLISESNNSSDLISPVKDKLHINNLQSEGFVELVSEGEEEICQFSDDDKISKNQDSEIQELVEVNKIILEDIAKQNEEKTESTDEIELNDVIEAKDDDKISKNQDSEIQELVEVNEITPEDIAKPNEEKTESTEEIELNYDIEAEIPPKQLDSQLKSYNDEEGVEEEGNLPDCESITHSENNSKVNSEAHKEDESLDMSKTLKELNSQLKSFIDEEGIDEDEHMEVPDCEPRTYSENDIKGRFETQQEAEGSEMSNIELIDSSDSEDDVIEEQHEMAVIKESTNKELCMENSYTTSLSVDNGKCMNDYTKRQVDIELHTDDCLPGQSPHGHNIDPNIRGEDKYQKLDIDKKENTNKCYERENITYPSNETETNDDQSRIDLIEDETEPRNSFHIKIENPHSIRADEPGLENPASDVRDNRLNNQVTNQTDTFKSESVENYEERYSEENLNENYEDEELNKSEEGSCDIYKGLSDSGSDVDAKTEDSQFGESLSSELHSGSGDSEEEYVTSIDDEEENEEDKSGLLNEICSGSDDLKSKELILSKDGEKANKNPDSPMTYDKALAIINQNRVRKIDDEEFFDMFTQELNRVSEQSGSDSDIAIVDEYLMEPEEPAKKNQPKAGNAQNSKQPPRPSGPVLTNQSVPHENYPGDFSHPIHTQHGPTLNQHGLPIPHQHSHPTMQRVNFPQGPLYQPLDQNMHLRGQLMFNQYAPSSSRMQDPHMFNPPPNVAHPDVNFSRGIFNHPHSHGPVPESSFPLNNTPLKIRTLPEMNNAQSFSNKSYFNPPHQAPLDERNFEHHEGKDGYLNIGSTSVAEAHNIDTGGTKPTIPDKAVSDKKDDTSRTPILDVLGLDKKSLKLLKKVLGLNSIKRKIMKRDLEWQKKCLERSILKSELRQRGRKNETRYRNVKKISQESDSSSLKSSSEMSSGESSLSSSFFKGKNFLSSSENDNREVNIEEGSVFVTLKRKRKSRHRNEKEFFKLKKSRHSGQESLDTVKQINKTKFSRKRGSSVVELNSKKMTKKQTVVKSQSGTFTVDPLTGSSQSSDSEIQSSDDRNQIKELKRIKRDLASGKNKLSNMFSQRPFKKSKESKGNESEPSQENKGPLRRENLRKLPSEILETLAKEDKKKKRHRAEDTGSDDTVERPTKIRKRSQRMKVKSKSADQNYIPCVTGGATEFGLSRLDKDGTLTLAEKAAKFRTDQLYGAPVKRITSKELMNMKKKQNINNALAMKKMSKKRNTE